jgi:hypothetical protein
MRLACPEKVWRGYGCLPIDIAPPQRAPKVGMFLRLFAARVTLMRHDGERAREWPRCGTVRAVGIRPGKMRVVHPRGSVRHYPETNREHNGNTHRRRKR